MRAIAGAMLLLLAGCAAPQSPAPATASPERAPRHHQIIRTPATPEAPAAVPEPPPCVAETAGAMVIFAIPPANDRPADRALRASAPAVTTLAETSVPFISRRALAVLSTS